MGPAPEVTKAHCHAAAPRKTAASTRRAIAEQSKGGCNLAAFKKLRQDVQVCLSTKPYSIGALIIRVLGYSIL